MADDPLTAALAEIRKRTAKAARGPWKAVMDRGLDLDGDPWNLPSVEGPDGNIILGAHVGDSAANTRFAAAAREDVPRLLAVVDAVLAEHTQHVTLNFPAPGICTCCCFSWPCRTVLAITRALLGETSGG